MSAVVGALGGVTGAIIGASKDSRTAPLETTRYQVVGGGGGAGGAGSGVAHGGPGFVGGSGGGSGSGCVIVNNPWTVDPTVELIVGQPITSHALREAAPRLCFGCGYELTAARIDRVGRCAGCGCPTGGPPSRSRGVGSSDLESPFGSPLSPPGVPRRSLG